jgi:putative hemolysin
MSTVFIIVLMGVLLILQGFFSGSEIALVSADRLRLQAEGERGSRGASIALEMLDHPARMLGTCLIGTNLCAISIATRGTQLVLRHLNTHPVVAVLLVVPFTLTLGEMVPKALYQHHANTLVPILAFPLRTLATALSPVLWIFEWVTSLAGGGAQNRRTVTREEIQLLLDGAQAPNLSPEDKALIRRVFAFTEAVVEEAMIPLIQVVAVPHTATCAEAARRMIESGHSRLPVYRERVDDISGILLHQDLIAIQDWSQSIQIVTRTAMFVPETKRVDQLLLEMRRARQRMAIPVDEYGGAVGIITVEDLLEEIVGEIQDESDRERPRVRQTGKRAWIALGHAEREHLWDSCGLQLPEGDFETVAGFILSTLGRIPKAGEHITFKSTTLTAVEVTDRAILEVRIQQARR